MISETIEIRVTEIVKNNPSMDFMEAIKQAFIEEQKFLIEMIEQKTERSIKAKDQISKNVYGLAHILS
jgi:hypothetical protein